MYTPTQNSLAKSNLMQTRVISKKGNFTINIESFWDCVHHDYRFKIKETGEVCTSQKEAVFRAKKILKRKRDQYCKKYNIVKHVRTKIKKIEISEQKPVKNIWTQINITSV